MKKLKLGYIIIKQLIKTYFKRMNYSNLEFSIMQRLENELNKTLHYHGPHHTKEVLTNILLITKYETVTANELELLKIAALFHDIGFINVYNGHEEEGCKIAEETLATCNFKSEKIKQICGMIMATKIPQTPKNKLEKIIADADLLYLGTSKFKVIGDTLFEELKKNQKVNSLAEWNKIQVAFMNSHHYHTQYCIENYTAQKNENQNIVIKWLQKND